VIGRLAGRIVRRQPSEVLVDVGGVGYRVAIPLSTFYTLPPDGETVGLEIHTIVREDAILLFGFATLAEKRIFEALISVSGVGPKIGLAVLAGLSPDEIVAAVSSQDAPRLKAVPGVGRKLAERIVLELKDKVETIAAASGAPVPSRMGGGADEAESALVNLGYPATQAREAIESVRRSSPTGMPIEQLLREALRTLAR
jgi:Holliday junction DNA helicase RuvA